jgi:hypothetical protein
VTHHCVLQTCATLSSVAGFLIIRKCCRDCRSLFISALLLFNCVAFTEQEEEDRKYEVRPVTTWQDRLTEWKAIMEREIMKESLDVPTSKYEAEVDWPVLLDDIGDADEEKVEAPKPMRAFWVARKWWKYRPKLPYTYLLAKVLNQEVSLESYVLL